MLGCVLHNQKGTAQKINAGSAKKVCAWVSCDRVVVLDVSGDPLNDIKEARVSYNPRVAPHWVVDGVDADGATIDEIVSVGRSLYRSSTLFGRLERLQGLKEKIDGYHALLADGLLTEGDCGDEIGSLLAHEDADTYHAAHDYVFESFKKFEKNPCQQSDRL
jgi:hypothetical protein